MSSSLERDQSVRFLRPGLFRAAVSEVLCRFYAGIRRRGYVRRRPLFLSNAGGTLAPAKPPELACAKNAFAWTPDAGRQCQPAGFDKKRLSTLRETMVCGRPMTTNPCCGDLLVSVNVRSWVRCGDSCSGCGLFLCPREMEYQETLSGGHQGPAPESHMPRSKHRLS